MSAFTELSKRIMGGDLIIYAVNIHTGGGKVLLDTLLQQSPFSPVTAAFVDARYVPPVEVKIPFFCAHGKLWGRFKAEMQLSRYSRQHPTEEILFFGNIPPFFKKSSRSILYLQNCFLTRQVPLPRDSKKEMLRNWVESLLLRTFSHQIDEIWVQTEWMKTMTAQFLPGKAIVVKPFLPLLPNSPPVVRRDIDFIFVASRALNKRLDFFLLGLKKLDKVSLSRANVTIVLDNRSAIDAELENLKREFKNINLVVYNQLTRENLFSLYQRSRFFISTSRHESFCLPMHEAHHFGCELIVPKSGYTENLAFNSVQFQADSIQELTNILTEKLKSPAIPSD